MERKPQCDPTGREAWLLLEKLARSSEGSVEPALAMDEQVARYLRHALGEDPHPCVGVRLEMRGRIKVGRWLPFRASQLLAPRLGTVWRAKVAGVIVGSDRYVASSGGMDWRLFNRLQLVHAEGPDVARSAAERAAGESVWAPAAMLPGGDVTWSATSANEVQVSFAVDGHEVTLHHDIDEDGRLRSSTFQRWGDPDRTGTWRQLPFGVEALEDATFGHTTIPARGRAGWHFGTDRWDDGIFFEFEITDLEPLG